MPVRPADSQMPRFIDLNGAFYSLPLKPPFAFEGLTARVFPLRARLASLQRFCNSYLNVVPPEVGRFRAVMPYVYLMMLDYGKLAVQVTNLGWIAQREIYFGLPVQWYRVIDGQWIFHDWAMVTPFVYVDDDLSVPLGRMVYGWPKMMARLTPTLSAWMRDPLADINEATASATVFPELYQGRKLEQRVFLEVNRAAPMSNLSMPFDAQSPMAPWVIASNVADAVAGFSRDSLGLLEGLGMLPPHAASQPANYASMMEKMAQGAASMGQTFLSNTLNLKQFRQAENPDEYCYQSLTNGPMRVTSYNAAGLLGEERILLGDASGGYSIRLHEWPSLPIAQTLGLEVSRRWTGDGASVALLKPVMPFWYDVNMEYLPGSNLAWRTHDGVWRGQSGVPFRAGRTQKDVPHDDLLFNTTLSSAVDALAGPFRFSGTTIRVLPLVARRKALEQFIQGYLNDPLNVAKGADALPGTESGSGKAPDGPFRLWAAPAEGAGDEFAYVYLTATSFGDVTSKTNNIGDWANYEMAFLVPVKEYRRRDPAARGRETARTLAGHEDEWELCGVGLVPAFTYVDHTTAAVARVEVLGIPTMRAEFVSPRNAWMSEDGAHSDAKQEVLRVMAEVLPVVGEGQGSSMQTIVDVVLGERFDAKEPTGQRVIADRWGALLQLELERRKRTKSEKPAELNVARALAIDLLANRVPFSLYTMKQFRDVADADDACYQAIIRVPRTLPEIIDIREIEDPLLVHVHEFPTQPLVEMLGLVQVSVREDGAGIIYSLQPIRPFSLCVTMEEGLGQRLASRSGTLDWMPGEPTTKSVLLGNVKSGVGLDVVRLEDEGDPRKLEKTGRDWQAFARAPLPAASKLLGAVPPSEQVTKQLAEQAQRKVAVTGRQARDAVEELDPQLVIESILSREWGNWDENARWQKGKRALEKAYADALLGVPEERMEASQLAFVRGVLALTEKRPGDAPIRTAVTPMIEQLGVLSRLRVELETQWTVIATWGIARLYGPAEVGGAVPSEAEALTAMMHVLDLLGRISVEPIVGESAAADKRGDYAARDNRSRLIELNVRTFQPLVPRVQQLISSFASVAALMTNPDPARSREISDYMRTVEEVFSSRDTLREAVELVRKRCELQRDAVFNKLSRAYQKPDYCIRRDAIGSDPEHLFPRSESWDDQWYYGPGWVNYAARPPIVAPSVDNQSEKAAS